MGGAAVVGGALLAVTGGLAAPALAGFSGAILVNMGITGAVSTSLTAFASSTAGFAAITSKLGSAAGLMRAGVR